MDEEARDAIRKDAGFLAKLISSMKEDGVTITPRFEGKNLAGLDIAVEPGTIELKFTTCPATISSPTQTYK